ncbi:MAG: hypothetical protein P8X47_03835, partial [Ignavibacteriaceae bacterium]
FMLLFFNSLYAQSITVKIVRHVKKYSIVTLVKKDNRLNVAVPVGSRASVQWIGIDLPCATQLSVDIVTANKKYPLMWFVKENKFNSYKLKTYNQNDTVKIFGCENRLRPLTERNDYHYFLIGTNFKRLKAIDITYN